MSIIKHVTLQKIVPQGLERRSRWPCSLRRYIVGIAGSIPSDIMDIRRLCLLCVCVGSGLCDELITRSGESYGLFVCLTVCDLETSTMGPRRP